MTEQRPVEVESAYEPVIPEPGTFEPHRCYTDAEAQDARTHYEGQFERFKAAKERHKNAFTTFFVGLVVALVAFYTSASLFLIVPVVLATVAAAVVLVVTDMYCPPNPGIEVLRTHELEALADIAEGPPLVRATVQRWLDEGKQLRVRDLLACRAYARSYGSTASRQAALQRLRGTAPPEAAA